MISRTDIDYPLSPLQHCYGPSLARRLDQHVWGRLRILSYESTKNSICGCAGRSGYVVSGPTVTGSSRDILAQSP